MPQFSNTQPQHQSMLRLKPFAKLYTEYVCDVWKWNLNMGEYVDIHHIGVGCWDSMIEWGT